MLAPEIAEQTSAGFPLASVPTMHVKSLVPPVPVAVIVTVPPLSEVMYVGGPGLPVKVNGTPVAPTVTVAVEGLTVMDVTSPITVTVAVPLRP